MLKIILSEYRISHVACRPLCEHLQFDFASLSALVCLCDTARVLNAASSASTLACPCASRASGLGLRLWRSTRAILHVLLLVHVL